ncbi:MAG: hypothetical protein FWG42_04190 [Clostridiales bacterium]|nr:hypothetical protein [Clostridiales bacterium]
MTEPIISPGFSVADIHKIREYNYERTKDLPREAVRKYYADGADVARAEIERLRRSKNAIVK